MPLCSAWPFPACRPRSRPVVLVGGAFCAIDAGTSICMSPYPSTISLYPFLLASPSSPIVFAGLPVLAAASSSSGVCSSIGLSTRPTTSSPAALLSLSTVSLIPCAALNASMLCLAFSCLSASFSACTLSASSYLAISASLAALWASSAALIAAGSSFSDMAIISLSSSRNLRRLDSCIWSCQSVLNRIFWCSMAESPGAWASDAPAISGNMFAGLSE